LVSDLPHLPFGHWDYRLGFDILEPPQPSPPRGGWVFGPLTLANLDHPARRQVAGMSVSGSVKVMNDGSAAGLDPAIVGISTVSARLIVVSEKVLTSVK
jgi:hypothetical protein